MSNLTGFSSLIQLKLLHNDMYISIPYIKDNIPIGILLSCYGFSDEFINNNIDNKYSYSIIKQKNNMDKDDAREYLIKNSIQLISKEEKDEFINNLLYKDIFPHLNEIKDNDKYSEYIIYMIKLL